MPLYNSFKFCFLVGNVKDGYKIHCWGHCKSYSKIWRIEVGYTFQVTTMVE